MKMQLQQQHYIELLHSIITIWFINSHSKGHRSNDELHSTSAPIAMSLLSLRRLKLSMVVSDLNKR
jgi:hypothetical protein